MTKVFHTLYNGVRNGKMKSKKSENSYKHFHFFLHMTRLVIIVLPWNNNFADQTYNADAHAGLGLCSLCTACAKTRHSHCMSEEEYTSL